MLGSAVYQVFHQSSTSPGKRSIPKKYCKNCTVVTLLSSLVMFFVVFFWFCFFVFVFNHKLFEKQNVSCFRMRGFTADSFPKEGYLLLAKHATE